MNTILIIVAVLLIGFVVLPLIVKIALALFLRKLSRATLEEVGKTSLKGVPLNIHLARVDNHPWADPDKVAACTDPILSRGFEDAGTYGIAEMPGVFVRLLVNAANSAAAAVYEHPQAGTWMDVYSRYNNGENCTYTTTPDRGLDKRPGSTVKHLPGTDAAALYDQFLNERKTGNLEPLDTGRIASLFEETYARDQAWRQNKGISADEVARHIQTDPGKA